MIASLAEMTWKEVSSFVSPRVIALWPIGAIEAHGPHLPLATDVIISEETAKRVAKRLHEAERDVLLIPPLAFTPAAFAGSHAGTVSLTEATATAQLVEVARSLAMHGIRTLVLVNSHVDPANVVALRNAAEEISTSVKIRLVAPDITKRPWVHRLPEEFKTGGAHAGVFETSLVMAARPKAVREEIRRSLPKVEVNLARKIKEGARTFRECGGPEAYFGDPASATAELGDRYYDVLVGIMMEAIDQPI